jgi:hypothetical protein
MEDLHHLNILLHVLAGSIALIAGLVALIVRKGSIGHIRFGRYFMRMIIVVIATGLIGVFVFKRNNFLLVITLLSAYNCFSGIRAIRLRGQRPAMIDRVVPLIVIAAALYYLYYISSIGLYWTPVIIYSTIGALFLVTCYDLCKIFFSQRLLQKSSGYEHVYKMVSAFSGITSAFTGTVFPQYQPYSQFLPSVIGLAYIIVTFIGLSNKRSKCTQL